MAFAKANFFVASDYNTFDCSNNQKDDSLRRTLSKKYAHSIGHQGRLALHKIKDFADLLYGDTIKPFDELRGASTAFEGFKPCRYQPRSSPAIRVNQTVHTGICPHAGAQ